MAFRSVNPFNDQVFAEYDRWSTEQVNQVLAQAHEAQPEWALLGFEERARLMRAAAEVLRSRVDDWAEIITREMGKRIVEARGEVEKCAWVCEYYADHAESFLADQLIESDAGRSLVAWQPLGTVLAVMPWNFPFWQVFRFAAPTLMAGNTGVLKHASNVPRSALAIEAIFREAGFPQGVFRTLMISAGQVETVIEDERVHAVTLTGSEPAGRAVAATAGRCLKPSVLELGGSDPFIVLEDADLDQAVEQAVTSRFINGGQSCIAAKRFILVESVADAFLERFKQAVEALEPGDPLEASTTLQPMARQDLRDELHEQVADSIEAGAEPVTGCRPLDRPGAFYAASILDRVEPGMRAYAEELFGPVAVVIRARDADDAVRIANESRFGLGGSVWTRDSDRGEAVARRVESGSVFVNGMVKSDPRLPFGGIKSSGYGRELSDLGIKEFVNAKTIWVK